MVVGIGIGRRGVVGAVGEVLARHRRHVRGQVRVGDLQAVIDNADHHALATDAIAEQAIDIEIVAGHRQRIGRHRLPGIEQMPLDTRQRVGLLRLGSKGQAAEYQGSGQGQARRARWRGALRVSLHTRILLL
ncbi:hypothetical protein D3C72_1656960 [compost metagenome]